MINKKIVSFVLLIITFVSFSVLSADSKFKISAEDVNAKLGESFVSKIQIKVPKGYFIYTDELDIEFESLEGIIIEDIKYPDPISWKDPHGGNVEMVYDKDFNVTILGKIPNDADKDVHELVATVSLQGCTPKICLFPEERDVLIAVNVNGGATKEVEPKVRPTIERRLPYDIPALFVAGLLSAFTPCVWPLIPIVLLFAGVAGGLKRKKEILDMVLMVFGLLLTYVIIGYGIASVGKVLAEFFMYRWFLGALAFLFILMSLATVGIIPFPAITKEIPFLKKSTPFASFFAGIGIGLLASPCTAPVLAAVASYTAWHGNPLRGAFFFFVYGFGFALAIVFVSIIAAEIRHRLSKKVVRFSRYILGALLLLPAIFYLSIVFPCDTVENGITWVKPQIAFNLAKKEKRPIMIEFTAKWCSSCRKMNKVLNDSEIVKLSYRLIPSRVDATFTSSDVEDILKKYSVKGVPAIIFLSPEGEMYDDLTLYSSNQEEIKKNINLAITRANK